MENMMNIGNTTTESYSIHSHRISIYCEIKLLLYSDVCHPDARHESSASIALNQLRKHITESIIKSFEYLLSVN